MHYGELTSPDLARVAPRSIAVLPVAAVEQHGQHLPVFTDTAIVSEIARRAEAALPRKVALLPTLWAGSSHHHLGFPGTLSISSETYIAVLIDLVESLMRTGFRRIVLLNGHGGNQVPAAEALYRLNRRHEGRREPWVAAATYWKLAAPGLQAQDFMETPALSHACEYETSLMLSLRVDWVKMIRARGHQPSVGSAFYDPLGHAPSRVVVSESFAQRTPTGALGSPEKASAAKGDRLFELISASVVEFLRDFATWKHPRRP